jgi:hypothetical protein
MMLKSIAEEERMTEHKPNREYRASLFVSLFSEPEKLIELYNALSGTDYPPDTQVEIATLNDVLFMDRINDLAFVLGGKLVILVEHQSTINENMPLRFLIYLGRVYEKIIDSGMLYRYGLVKIPAPDFIVVYNGDSDLPEQSMLKLSDAFEATPEFKGRFPMELEATVYNVNKGYNAALVRRSETLDGYVSFIDKVKAHVAAGTDRTEAFARAIQECIDEGVLATYLKKHGSEVLNMLTQEWDMGKALDTRFMEGVERGISQGVNRGIIETARRMLSNGLKPEEIARYTGLSIEKIKSLQPLPPEAGPQKLQH